MKVLWKKSVTVTLKVYVPGESLLKSTKGHGRVPEHSIGDPKVAGYMTAFAEFADKSVNLTVL